MDFHPSLSLSWHMELYIIFSLPCPVEKRRNRAALVGTWGPAGVNTLHYNSTTLATLNTWPWIIQDCRQPLSPHSLYFSKSLTDLLNSVAPAQLHLFMQTSNLSFLSFWIFLHWFKSVVSLPSVSTLLVRDVVDKISGNPPKHQTATAAYKAF